MTHVQSFKTTIANESILSKTQHHPQLGFAEKNPWYSARCRSQDAWASHFHVTGASMMTSGTLAVQFIWCLAWEETQLRWLMAVHVLHLVTCHHVGVDINMILNRGILRGILYTQQISTIHQNWTCLPCLRPFLDYMLDRDHCFFCFMVAGFEELDITSLFSQHPQDGGAATPVAHGWWRHWDAECHPGGGAGAGMGATPFKDGAFEGDYADDE